MLSHFTGMWDNSLLQKLKSEMRVRASPRSFWEPRTVTCRPQVIFAYLIAQIMLKSAWHKHFISWWRASVPQQTPMGQLWPISRILGFHIYVRQDFLNCRVPESLTEELRDRSWEWYTVSSVTQNSCGLPYGGKLKSLSLPLPFYSILTGWKQCEARTQPKFLPAGL